MYLATLFYSPIVLVMSLVGASVGSIFGEFEYNPRKTHTLKAY